MSKDARLEAGSDAREMDRMLNGDEKGRVVNEDVELARKGVQGVLSITSQGYEASGRHKAEERKSPFEIIKEVEKI